MTTSEPPIIFVIRDLFSTPTIKVIKPPMKQRITIIAMTTYKINNLSFF